MCCISKSSNSGAPLITSGYLLYGVLYQTLPDIAFGDPSPMQQYSRAGATHRKQHSASRPPEPLMESLSEDLTCTSTMPKNYFSNLWQGLRKPWQTLLSSLHRSHIIRTLHQALQLQCNPVGKRKPPDQQPCRGSQAIEPIGAVSLKGEQAKQQDLPTPGLRDWSASLMKALCWDSCQASVRSLRTG